jgi:hypothetical protein
MQPVIDAIIDLAENAAKEPRDFQPTDSDVLKAEVKKLVGGPARRLQDHHQGRALRRPRRRQGQGRSLTFAEPTATRPPSTR